MYELMASSIWLTIWSSYSFVTRLESAVAEILTFSTNEMQVMQRPTLPPGTTRLARPLTFKSLILMSLKMPGVLLNARVNYLLSWSDMRCAMKLGKK